ADWTRSLYVLVSRTRATGATGSRAIKGRRPAADLKIATYFQEEAVRLKLPRNRVIRGENRGVRPDRTTRYPCYALPGEATGPLASFVARPEGGRTSPSAKR